MELGRRDGLDLRLQLQSETWSCRTDEAELVVVILVNHKILVLCAMAVIVAGYLGWSVLYVQLE